MKTHLIAGTCEITDVNGFLHTLGGIASGYGITVQAIDASKTAGNEHILAAAEKAIRAVQRHDSISDDLGMEILLYASGNRQIKKALSMGVRTGRNEIVLVAVGDGGGCDRIHARETGRGHNLFRHHRDRDCGGWRREDPTTRARTGGAHGALEITSRWCSV